MSNLCPFGFEIGQRRNSFRLAVAGLCARSKRSFFDVHSLQVKNLRDGIAKGQREAIRAQHNRAKTNRLYLTDEGSKEMRQACVFA